MAPVIAVLYEHPHWFKPLFTELERRGQAFELWHADKQVLAIEGAQENPVPPALIFNRMSPSGWQRQRASALQYTAAALAVWEGRRIRVVNGSTAWGFELSKAKQAALIHNLGLRVPRTMVVSHREQLLTAAESLTAPYVVKPNVGGSGAGIQRFDSASQLRDAVAEDRIITGPDGVLLLQEFHAPEDECIYRVETLGGRYLYGIRIGLAPDAGFDLCPADICRSSSGVALSTEACPVEARKNGLEVAAQHPEASLITAVERLVQAARIDVGGVEYLRSRRDGELYFYDINALSNFVSGPRELLGFDPTERLVDQLLGWLPSGGAKA